jgi:peptidoglycan/xylan/chitin deacetylase (PgdA/CDA1 family)
MRKPPAKNSETPDIAARMASRAEPYRLEWGARRHGTAARMTPGEKSYRRLVEIVAQDSEERQRGIRSQKIISGNPDKPYVALTFDDGPHGSRTTDLLKILRRLSVPSTFFVVGMEAREYPKILEQIVLEGHEIGNHTYHHYRLPRIPLEEVGPEINMAQDLIHSLIGLKTRLFRPPGGEYNSSIQRVIEQHGHINVLWTDDPADYTLGRTPEVIEQFVLRDITPGGIILLHDGVRATYDALPKIVSKIRAKGYIFVTVSELIQRGGGVSRINHNRISRTSAQ